MPEENLPRKNKKKKSKKSGSFFMRFFKVSFFIGLFFLIFVIGVFAYYAKDLPNPQDVLEKPLDQSAKIYARDEETLLYEVFEEGKRTVVELDQISPHVKDAIIAIEDKDFYKHPGIDLKAMVRIVWVALKTGGSRIEGASTITQQFIRNSLLTLDRTLSRKIKEIILSLELERRYTKEEILAFYLNQIPYGSNAYGVEAAAQTFFGKSAEDVSLAEAAILAAIPKAQTRLSPYGNNPDLLRQRQELVLKLMKDQGYINQEEFEQALEEEIVYQKQTQGIKAPHFVIYIKEQLEEKYGEDAIETGGLKIITTLDWELQEKAEEIVSKRAEVNEQLYGAKNAALVAIDPQTGEVLAMVGSRDYFDLENDGNVNVALRDRQPGSAFKPFAYATAFEKGYTPDTLLFDVRTEFNPYCVSSAVQGKDKFGLDCYHPQNYDLKERGPITMRSSLAQSLNIPSVKTLYLAGINDSIELAQKMGITTLEDRDRFGLALVLGGGEVKLIDMTSAFGVFAAEGKRHEPYSIVRVEDVNGEVLEEHENERAKQVLDKDVARMINGVLSDNEARTPMFGASSNLYLGNIAAAAKTGTTQEYRDGWTIGYTPNLAIGVWTGNNDNTSMSRTAGVSTAGPIWHDLMLFAMQDRQKINFTSPTIIKTDKPVLSGQIGGEVVKIDTVSGKRATDATPPELIEEKIFRQAHSILYYVSKDDPQGSVPKNPSSDPQFENWEAAVKSWANDPDRGNWTDEVPPDEYDDVHTNNSRPDIKITSPRNGKIIESTSFLIKTDIESENKIKQVDFFFDDEFLGSKVNSPYSWTVNLIDKEDLSGRHKLTVKVYDEYLNSDQTSINVYTNINESSNDEENDDQQESNLTLLNPSQTDFPFTINLSIAGEFNEIKLYYSTYSSLTSSFLVTKNWTKLSSSNYQYIWDEDLPDDTYYLYVLGEDEDENVLMSNTLSLSLD